MTERTPTTDGTATDAPPDYVATSREVAKFLKTTEVSLAGLRYKGLGPAYIRIPGGRSIRYRWSDVEAWLEAGKVQTDNSRRRARA